MQQTSQNNYKYHPWVDWYEWLQARALLTQSPKEALTVIVGWVSKNSPMMQSSPHHKYLKMQKIMLQQKLQTPANLEASNLRLIQLVEMGASTSKYRKSKQGGKLAMKNIAEELGFPKTLVTLRHQAVHECRDGSMHGAGVLQFAFNLLQQFLDENYWDVVERKIRKRDSHFHDFCGKLQAYTVHSDPKYRLPLFQEMNNKDERMKVLAKFTKANLKLARTLDGTQLVRLLDTFVVQTMSNITITFQDAESLRRLASNVILGQSELPIMSAFKLKAELICFLFVFEQKYTQQLVTQLLYTNLIQRMVEIARNRLASDSNEHETKVYWTDALRVISLNSLFQSHLSITFKDLCKDVPLGIVSLYKELNLLSQVDFFANYLKSKLEFGKVFKANCERAFVTPVALGQGVRNREVCEVLSVTEVTKHEIQEFDDRVCANSVITLSEILNW